MTDAIWLLRAFNWCADSPDPKARVGAVLRLTDDSYVIGTNSLPEGIAPRPFFLLPKRWRHAIFGSSKRAEEQREIS